jgi:hypothetical protein
MYNISMNGFSDFGAYNIPAKTCPEGFDVVNHKGKYYCEKPASGIPYCPAGQSMRRKLDKNKDIKTCVPSTAIGIDADTGVLLAPAAPALQPQMLSMDLPSDQPYPETTTTGGLPTWAWGVIGGGAALVLLGGLFVVIKRRRAAKAAKAV